MVHNYFESLIVNYSSPMSFEKDLSLLADATDGIWFIDPIHHFYELVIFTVCSSLLFWYCAKRVFKNKTLLSLVKNQSKSKKNAMEVIVTLVTLFSYCLLFYHKSLRNKSINMLQMCHFNMGLLLVTLLSPKKYFVTHLLFNLYLFYIFGTILALSFPDLRGFIYFFEYENFFLEHYILLIVPFIMIYTRRYIVFPVQRSLLGLAFAVKALLILSVSTIIGLKYGVNVNYSLAPPPGYLETFGNYYRIFMTTMFLILMLFSRLFLINLFNITIVLINSIIHQEKSKAKLEKLQ